MTNEALQSLYVGIESIRSLDPAELDQHIQDLEEELACCKQLRIMQTILERKSTHESKRSKKPEFIPATDLDKQDKANHPMRLKRDHKTYDLDKSNVLRQVIGCIIEHGAPLDATTIRKQLQDKRVFVGSILVRSTRFFSTHARWLGRNTRSPPTVCDLSGDGTQKNSSRIPNRNTSINSRMSAVTIKMIRGPQDGLRLLWPESNLGPILLLPDSTENGPCVHMYERIPNTLNYSFVRTDKVERPPLTDYTDCTYQKYNPNT